MNYKAGAPGSTQVYLKGGKGVFLLHVHRKGSEQAKSPSLQGGDVS